MPSPQGQPIVINLCRSPGQRQLASCVREQGPIERSGGVILEGIRHSRGFGVLGGSITSFHSCKSQVGSAGLLSGLWPYLHSAWTLTSLA